MSQEFEQQEDDERLSTSFLSDLRDSMDEQEVSELNIDTSDETFRITSKEQAGFFIRKLQEVRNEANDINTTANTEIDRLVRKVDTWRDQELNRCTNAESYFLNLLQEFATKELAESDKKSLKLPFGTLAFKKQQDKFEYNDKTLLEYLKKNKINELIRTKEEPNKADLKKEATVKDGKLFYKNVEVEGVTVTVQEDKFEVK